MAVSGNNLINSGNVISMEKKLNSGPQIILQNIEDILLQQQHVKRARDPISIATINKKPLDSNKMQNDRKNIDRVADILEMGTQSRLVLNIFTSNTKEFIH